MLLSWTLPSGLLFLALVTEPGDNETDEGDNCVEHRLVDEEQVGVEVIDEHKQRES
jgi:hypothetical protein